MIKRMLIMLILSALVLGGVFGFKMYGMKMMKEHIAKASTPEQTVSTAKAGYTDWKNQIDAVGTFRAVMSANIAPEASGIVEKITFESGHDVEEGTPLLFLRSDEDKANLEALNANLKLAKLTLDRNEKQLKIKAISQATYDSSLASYENLKAQVTAQKAALDKKTIKAPFAGHLGLRDVDLGDYISAGTTIVNLQQLDPIYLDFAVPQQDLSRLQVGQKIIATADVAPGEKFEGTLTAIDSSIQESTRNINVRATIANPDKKLLPGMFASLEIEVGEPLSFLTLPQTAITFNTYGSTVYIVKESVGGKKTAEMSFVKTGLTRGDQIAITSGVKEGDVVVTSGQLKLHNGSPVKIDNSIQPLNDPNPQPKDQ